MAGGLITPLIAPAAVARGAAAGQGSEQHGTYARHRPAAAGDRLRRRPADPCRDPSRGRGLPGRPCRRRSADRAACRRLAGGRRRCPPAKGRLFGDQTPTRAGVELDFAPENRFQPELAPSFRREIAVNRNGTRFRSRKTPSTGMARDSGRGKGCQLEPGGCQIGSKARARVPLPSSRTAGRRKSCQSGTLRPAARFARLAQLARFARLAQLARLARLARPAAIMPKLSDRCRTRCGKVAAGATLRRHGGQKPHGAATFPPNVAGAPDMSHFRRPGLDSEKGTIQS